MRDELAQQAHTWAKKSCAVQGLATKVTDPNILGQVAALLAGSETKRGHKATRSSPTVRLPRSRSAA
jgi:hypothetical protein